ncbi:MAG TPA: hypothetical protein VD993_17490 [Chitinophagaceae bacterium]|nr:hypothetical protein [Chitinophagaceae bacterium]
MPSRWKYFRVICILQLILSGFMAGHSFVYFMMRGRGIDALDTVCFTFIALFASFGMTLLQNNYPDTLLETSQKRYFNFLYIANFLLVSFVGAHIYNERWAMELFTYGFGFDFWDALQILLPAIIYTLILVFQIRILYGMFRLRRELYANYLKLVEQIASGETS